MQTARVRGGAVLGHLVLYPHGGDGGAGRPLLLHAAAPHPRPGDPPPAGRRPRPLVQHSHVQALQVRAVVPNKKIIWGLFQAGQQQEVRLAAAGEGGAGRDPEHGREQGVQHAVVTHGEHCDKTQHEYLTLYYATIGLNVNFQIIKINFHLVRISIFNSQKIVDISSLQIY